MDSSFDQFGGGGWGEHGDGDQQYENSSILQPLHQKSVYDKVPVQVEIDDLLKMSPDEEHFMIGKYKFNTIRVIGKIVNIHTDPNQSTSTYEVCDPLAPDPRTARRLTVIVINQEDNSRVVSNKAYLNEGQIIHIMGKTRPYNNRMSLLSIHIRDIDMDEIELFKMECKLAKHYYQKNFPDLPAQALENTIFKILPTPKEQQQTRPGTGMSANRPASMTPSTRSGYGGGGGGGYSNAPPTTPVRSNSNAMQMLHHQAQSSNSYGLTLQQKRIYDFILRFAESNSGGSGVHVEQIRAHVRPNNEFNDDLQFLQNDGKIYTTVDDDHYAIVE